MEWHGIASFGCLRMKPKVVLMWLFWAMGNHNGFFHSYYYSFPKVVRRRTVLARYTTHTSLAGCCLLEEDALGCLRIVPK